jgi:hypothetical protein
MRRDATRCDAKEKVRRIGLDKEYRRHSSTRASIRIKDDVDDDAMHDRAERKKRRRRTHRGRDDAKTANPRAP